MQNYPLRIDGEKSGPTSVILAAVHGNEPCGIEAFETILPNLKIDCGTVIFDIGNPRALEQKTRFVDTNLNRMFRKDDDLSDEQKSSYEYGRSRELMALLDSASALLDIHSSRNPESRRFVICEGPSIPLANRLPFNLICMGFDKFHPGATDGYMFRKKKIGACIECGQHEDPKAARVAIEGIYGFLDVRGHMNGRNYWCDKKILTIFDMYKNQSTNFKFAREFADFEDIPEGTLIATDEEYEVRAPKNCKIIFAVKPEKLNSECFLLAKN